MKRWEAKRGLPVRRIPGGAKATVYAEVAELEHWLKGARPRAAGPAGSRRTRLVRRGRSWSPWRGGGGLQGCATQPPQKPRAGPPSALAGSGRPLFRRPLQFRAPLAGEPEPRRAAVQRGDPPRSRLCRGLCRPRQLPPAAARICRRSRRASLIRARAAAAERALALDDGLADAHAALAFVTFFYDRDFAAGLAASSARSRSTRGSAGAHHWYATALYHADRVPDALAQIDAAQRLEPQSQAILADKALILFAAGRSRRSDRPAPADGGGRSGLSVAARLSRRHSSRPGRLSRPSSPRSGRPRG